MADAGRGRTTASTPRVHLHRDARGVLQFRSGVPSPDNDLWVLVHGWGSSAVTWAPHLDRLSEVGAAIAPDLAGHGGTPACPTRITIDSLVEDIATLARAYPARRRIVVGHSLGGTVAAVLAERRPELVDALVLIDPSYGADEVEMATVPGRLDQYRRDGGMQSAAAIASAFSAEASTELLLRAAHDVASTPAEVLASLFESNYLTPGAVGPASAARDWVQQRTAPTLAFFPSDTRAALDRQHTRSTTTVVWPGAGHFLHVEQHERFLDETLRWFRSRGYNANQH